ncbi:MAG: hypothetical protein V3T87_00945 [Candidatus Thorarchaeota archaeon]|jgi:OFA family oxalate/formate antiporter-like MFS transporter
MSENVGNRHLVIVSAIIVQLCLGTIYAWSVFQDVLETGSGWERLYTQLPFAAGLASFALFMIFAGKTVLDHGKSLR